MLHNLFLTCKLGIVVTSSPQKMGSKVGVMEAETGTGVLSPSWVWGWRRWSFLKKEWDFPGGPVAKTLHSQCREPRSGN